MTCRVTIVMYHYVRDNRSTKYPRIKGLDIRDFENQLSYLQRHYIPVGVEDLNQALEGHDSLPKNAVMLTFDDGYADHYKKVFPVLNSRGIPGLFFVPAKPIMEKVVLDVNKIHLILASVPNPAIILNRLRDLIEKRHKKWELRDFDYYASNVNIDSRFDSPEIVLIKRILQKRLPNPIRHEIVSQLFQEFVSKDEAGFSEELYLSRNQLKEMVNEGMYIGNHGYSHEWMTNLNGSACAFEIQAGLDFLCSIGGVNMKGWAFSYPYGDYTQEIIRFAANLGCGFAVTTCPDIATLSADTRYELPRLDTNDFPIDSESAPCDWTRFILGEK